MGEYAPQAIWDAYYTVAAGISSAEMSGIVGNSAHTYGYHRGRNYVSSWDYSCQYDADLRGSGEAASALDISFGEADMATVTQRLINAVDDGDPRVQVLREFYGTTNGWEVTGRDIPTGDWITSDSSHLWHVHMSGFRQYADDSEAWQGVAAIVLGQEEVELTPEESAWLKNINAAIFTGGSSMPWGGQSINKMLGDVYGSVVRQNDASPDALPMASTEGASYSALFVGTAEVPPLVTQVADQGAELRLLNNKMDVLLRRTMSERGREEEGPGLYDIDPGDRRRSELLRAGRHDEHAIGSERGRDDGLREDDRRTDDLGQGVGPDRGRDDGISSRRRNPLWPMGRHEERRDDDRNR